MGHTLNVHPHAKAGEDGKARMHIMGVCLGLAIHDEEPQPRQMRLAHLLMTSQRCTGISFIRSDLEGLDRSR